MIEKGTKIKENTKKLVNETAFLSQISFETPLRIAKRPKSSQGFVGKNENGKKLIERFNKVFKELNTMDRSFPRRGSHKQSNEKLSQTASKSKSNKGKLEGGHEILKFDSDSNLKWSAYQTNKTYKKSQPHQQHLKKNALREQVRPVVRIPPSKAFPKEMEVINKFLGAGKHKTANRHKLPTKDKGLSKSVCVDVNY